MAIKVAVLVEPLSPISFGTRTEVVLVRSDAARVLKEEMRRYCNGQTRGRSFLVAGHRGSGKTTMVEHAFLELWKETRGSGATVRPLRVLLSGPSLLGDGVRAERPAGSAAGGQKPTQAADNAQKPAPAADGGGARQDGKPAAGKPEAGPHAGGANGGDQSPAAAETDEASTVVANALIQVTMGLHRAVAQDFAESYRHRALERTGSDPRLYTELPELAAQLEVELFEAVRPARLREFWAHGGFLGSGVLFPRPRVGLPGLSPYAGLDARGMRELLALAGVCEAYRRISGELKQTEKQTDAVKSETSAAVATAQAGAELLKGLAALFTGGLVGGSILSANGGPAVSLAGGLAAALGAAAVFRYSVARSRTRTMDREIEFVPNLTVQTLDRVLPIIVERLRAAGLAPIFVVDELDKVENLSVHIETLVTHLKKFVSESAFFCFLTDRSYFEAMQARSRLKPYSKEYTYFSHQLFVAHRAADLHQFLTEVLVPEDDEDRADAQVLEYIALHRAEMHIVDLQRVLARWRGNEGVLTIPRGIVRSASVYRLDLRAQVAVEIVLDGPELTALLEREPGLRQVVHDAVYYPARKWKEGKDLALGPGAEAEFRSYLESRVERDQGLPDEVSSHIPEGMAERLLAHARAVAALLADDTLFRTEFEAWDTVRKQRGLPQVSAAVRDALKVDVPDEMLALLKAGGAGRYTWRYNTAGTPAGARVPGVEIKEVKEEEWQAAAILIRAFQQALAEVA